MVDGLIDIYFVKNDTKPNKKNDLIRMISKGGFNLIIVNENEIINSNIISRSEKLHLLLIMSYSTVSVDAGFSIEFTRAPLQETTFAHTDLTARKYSLGVVKGCVRDTVR
jgi:hypothetical protein